MVGVLGGKHPEVGVIKVAGRPRRYIIRGPGRSAADQSNDDRENDKGEQFDTGHVRSLPRTFHAETCTRFANSVIRASWMVCNGYPHFYHCIMSPVGSSIVVDKRPPSPYPAASPYTP